MAVGLSPINRAFNQVPKRAESRQTDRLRDTFVDSGVAAALEAIDHQVLYGRRGTGKTHAFRYLQHVVQTRNEVAVYVDLRTMGSPEGLFLGNAVDPTQRASRLLVDLLGELHDALLEAALEDDELLVDSGFVSKLDALDKAISEVRISGDVEISEESEDKTSEKKSSSIGGALSEKPRIEGKIGKEIADSVQKKYREIRKGSDRIALNFAQLARALRELAESLSTRRLWLLLDEWSSVPPATQPFLAEFLVRCVLPRDWIDRRAARVSVVEAGRFTGCVCSAAAVV